MFNSTQLSRLIALQEKSYRLLRWVKSALDKGTVRFDTIHQAMSASEAAFEWINRHYANIPDDS